MTSVQKIVHENVYQIGKLSAMDQFHVTRRLATVSTALAESFALLREGGGLKSMTEGGAVLAVLEPVVKAIGTMRDEDAEFVISKCLSVVYRRQGSASAPVWAPVQVAPGQLMFPDIDMPVMMRLTWETLQHNLSGFISDLFSGLADLRASEEQRSS